MEILIAEYDPFIFCDEDYMTVISGLPGSGKSFLASLMPVRFIHLDNYCNHTADGWSCDLSILIRYPYYEGIAVNFDELSRMLRLTFPNRKLVLVWITPTYTMWRRAQIHHICYRDNYPSYYLRYSPLEYDLINDQAFRFYAGMLEPDFVMFHTPKDKGRFISLFGDR